MQSSRGLKKAVRPREVWWHGVTIRAGRGAAQVLGRVFPEGIVLTETRGERAWVRLRSRGQSRVPTAPGVGPALLSQAAETEVWS